MQRGWYPNKVDGSYVACFFKWTLIFDQYVIWRASKREHLYIYKKRHEFKRDWIAPSKITNYFTFNSEHNQEDLYIFSYEINKLALPTTITKSIKILFSIRFLHTFRCRFTNATQVLLCKSKRSKRENVNNEPNNTHIPKHHTSTLEGPSQVSINSTLRGHERVQSNRQ